MYYTKKRRLPPLAGIRTASVLSFIHPVRTYEVALERELRLIGLTVERQRSAPVVYKEHVFSRT